MSGHTIGFAEQLVPLVVNGSKTLTYRLGQKYAGLKPSDRLIAEDSSTGSPIAEIEVIGVTSGEFGDLPIDRPGHETYRSKDEQRKVFQGFYGREIADDEPVTTIEFKVTRLLLAKT